MMAWGSRIDQLERPIARTKSAVTQSDAGGLSTVIELPASEEPQR